MDSPTHSGVEDCRRCAELKEQLIEVEQFRNTLFMQVKDLVIEVNRLKQAVYEQKQGTISVQNTLAKCESELIDLINIICTKKIP